MSEQLRAASFLDKGGTGKTTTVAHLGVALSERGNDVLLIDLAGKQADLAKNFGVWEDYQERIEAEDDWPNISTVFREQWTRIAKKIDDPLDELVYDTGEGPDLIPAHPGLDGLDTELNDIEEIEERYSRLEEFLDSYVSGYDVVLIDLPGSTNNISYNGLWAAQHVVVPVEAGPFEAQQAETLKSDLERISDRFDVDVELTMLVMNKTDQRTKLSEEFADEYSAAFDGVLAPHEVPRSQDVRNAAVEGRTLYAERGLSESAKRALEAFEENAEELERRLKA